MPDLWDDGHAIGWEEAIQYVLEVVEEMKLNKAYFDEKTLEELKQRIV